jgi:hypothetical protein
VDAEITNIFSDYGVSFLKHKISFGTGNVSPESIHDTTIISPDTVNNGAWHYIVATRQKSNGSLKLYVGGGPVLQPSEHCHVGGDE